jgi:hypothetical protein
MILLFTLICIHKHNEIAKDTSLLNDTTVSTSTDHKESDSREFKECYVYQGMSENDLILLTLDAEVVEYRRSTAVRELGERMRIRAIPLLIDRITYQGTGREFRYGKRVSYKSVTDAVASVYDYGTQKNLLSRYPCVDALVDIGWPSVPALIVEYIRIWDSPTFDDDVARDRIIDTIELQGNKRLAVAITTAIHLFGKSNSRTWWASGDLIRRIWADKSYLR